jgi:hypothetical protein
MCFFLFQSNESARRVRDAVCSSTSSLAVDNFLPFNLQRKFPYFQSAQLPHPPISHMIFVSSSPVRFSLLIWELGVGLCLRLHASEANRIAGK